MSAVERAIVFFYLALLDESKAQAATAEAVHQFRKKGLYQVQDLQPEKWAEFVAILNGIFKKYRTSSRATGAAFTSGNLILPSSLKWSTWLEFHRLAEPSDCQAVLFNKILGLSDSVVSQGLQVSEGTVRFRVARSLRLLGGLNA